MNPDLRHVDMGGLLQLARPVNCIMSAVGVLIGGIVAVGAGAWGAFARPIGLAAVAALAFTAGGNALNDLYDTETDKVNHPERPLPSGKLSVEAAKVFAASAFVAAAILAVFVNVFCLAVVAVNATFMFAYEARLKAVGTPGNVGIAYLVGSLFLFAGAAVLSSDTDPLFRATVLAVLAFCATLGREITKDIEDMAGDVDRRTLPQRIGAKSAGGVAATALAAGVVLSFVPWLYGVLRPAYLVVVLFADGMFIYAALYSAAKPARSQRVTKYAMIVALVAFLAGGLL